MRKPKFTRPVTVYLTEEAYQQIKIITDSAEISIGEWVRSAINNTLTAEEKGA